MNSRRLARLMEIICIIKAHPRRDPDEMCARLDISRRQFYKDRDSLAELGFNFHFSRKKAGFVLDREDKFNAGPISLADLFALIEAVTRLGGPQDFPLALAGLKGLQAMAAHLPENLKPLFENAIQDFIFQDRFKCEPQVFWSLHQAAEKSRRVIVVEQDGETSRQTELIPARLQFSDGALQVEAVAENGADPLRIGLERVRRVIALEPMEQELPFPA